MRSEREYSVGVDADRQADERAQSLVERMNLHQAKLLDMHREIVDQAKQIAELQAQLQNLARFVGMDAQRTGGPF